MLDDPLPLRPPRISYCAALIDRFRHRVLLRGLTVLCLIFAVPPMQASAGDGAAADGGAFPDAELIPNCARTGGGIAVAEPQGKIYYCLQRVIAIERKYPGASKFFFLHEFGHIVLQSGDELKVDCWTVNELRYIADGVKILLVARRYIEQFKLFDTRYGGTGADRSELLQGCYDEGMNWLARARKNGTRPPPPELR